MKTWNHYSTEEKERKVFVIIMTVIMLAIIAWGVMEICGVFDKPEWEPTVSYPMANAKISWEETHYYGGWTE